MGRRNGLHIIRIAKGFGMEVVASDVIRNRLHAEVLGFRYVDTDELLACLDLPAHSQDAILPVAELVAAFSSPGQGVLHLIQMIVTPEEASEAE